MNIGCRILRRRAKVSADLVERYRSLPTANISDSMGRMSGGAKLRPVHKSGVLAGPALTVKCPPGDNLMVYKALDVAEPGDVLVIDAGGDLTQAIVGDLMTARATMRGIVGFVVNGAVRDSGEIGAGSFPVYAAGITHRGPYKNGPGEIGVPVVAEGMVVMPGDLVLGDEDGIVCVPREAAEEVCVAAYAKMASEQKQLEEIRAGRYEQAWVDAALRDLGCEIEP